MKKLKLQVQLSLDGYMADAQGNSDWMVWNWGPLWTWDEALRQHFIDLTAIIDTVLLSRKMAEEGFINHWARVAADTTGPQHLFARSIAQARKVVFTKTLHEAVWENTHLAKGNLIEEVNKLKKEPGKDMIVYGGASFAASLIEARLIDEYHLFINPVALGNGLSLFNNPAHKFKLTLTDARSFDCGVTVLTYLPSPTAPDRTR
jgi:dihydrofolate reductase